MVLVLWIVVRSCRRGVVYVLRMRVGLDLFTGYV